ncbi:MAG: hypothetical protein IT378_15430 [Sandaracinaceae bacterium]|nr:hypothetical protein [Sandaracinaceae bacterium]
MRSPCLLTLLLAACGSSMTPDGGSTDAQTDAQTDAGAPNDGGADAGAVLCSFPAVQIAGTTETDALAGAAARCGQAPHAWSADATIGSVLAYSTTGLPRYSARELEGLAAAQGVILPEPLSHNTATVAITYVTQDRGAPVEATALVAYPRDLEPGAPAPDVVLLLHGSSGYADGCGPTHDFGSQILAALIASMGWVVVAPDYLGLRGDGQPTGFPHPYLGGQATAIASLDSVRALLRMDPARRGRLCPTSRVLVLGGSQGGHAALWAERLAPYYARELSLVGTVATVPPADVAGQMQRALTSVVPATRSTTVFYGLTPHWYGLGDRLGEVFLPPLDAQITGMLLDGCSPGGISAPATLEERFTPAILDAAARGELASHGGELGCIAAENGLTSTSIPWLPAASPSYAVLYALGELDDLVDPAIERASFDTLCASGMPLSYLECEGAGHIEATLWSLPEIVEFARARFAGEVVPPGELCVRGAPVRCRGTPP